MDGDERIVFETSGSAGPVKRIVHSRRGLEVSAAAVNEHLEVGRDSCWGLALPVSHVGGQGVVVRADLAGCRLAEFTNKWDAGRFVAWLEEQGVTHTSLVPTQVHDLVVVGRRAPEGLRAIVVGGDRLGSVTGHAARELGWPVLPSYGLTEAASQVATASLESLAHPYREAPLPVLPIWDVRVGDNGRLSLRGEALFIGRMADQEGGFEPREGEWFETGDLVEITSDGGLIPLGRTDSLVKVLGELVDPLAIERVLERADPERGWGDRAVVLAVPDVRAGHRLVAVVEGSGGEGVSGVLDDYNVRSPGFARVLGVERVEKFPRSGLGKVRRGEIVGRISIFNSQQGTSNDQGQRA